MGGPRCCYATSAAVERSAPIVQEALEAASRQQKVSRAMPGTRIRHKIPRHAPRRYLRVLLMLTACHEAAQAMHTTAAGAASACEQYMDCAWDEGGRVDAAHRIVGVMQDGCA